MTDTTDTPTTMTTMAAVKLPPATHRRGLLSGLLLSSFCALTACASPSASVAHSTPNLTSGDMSKGADNFYTSDRVSVQRVAFKNQYKMNVVGNLFVAKDS